MIKVEEANTDMVSTYYQEQIREQLHEQYKKKGEKSHLSLLPVLTQDRSLGGKSVP